MGPNCPNSFSRSFSLVYKLRPNTPRTLQDSGFSLFPPRLPPPPREGGDLLRLSRESGERDRLVSGDLDLRESGVRERLEGGVLDLDLDLDFDFDLELWRDEDLLLDGMVLVVLVVSAVLVIQTVH